MPEAEQGDAGGRFDEAWDDDDSFASIELGGPIEEDALPDRGRLVIQRVGITLEGPTPAIVAGIGVAGSLGGALIAEQPHALIAGLAAMGATLVHAYLYFHSAQRRYSPLRRGPRARTRARDTSR